ncbi:DUF308 domain-containing protein [uncultured Faecalicoccus sp.]|uniref:HdeD family acid-resistance protein n=1 Tax=uncultured Faecalicoccus sp. TaxID=1971760 RepID=UPI00260FC297|nr:DUF308 domain-containing protein [uncultured Faecalicoccus sp.]
MNHLINPRRKEVRMMALFYILFGLILIFLNKDLLSIAIRILGVALVAAGITFLYTYFGKRISVDTTPLFAGLPCLLVGIFLILSPESLIAMLPILTGIVIMVNSIIQLQKSFLLKDYGFSNWKISAIVSAICLGIGILLLLKPLQSVAFLMQVIGLSLIVEGVLLFGYDYTLHKYKKQFEEFE